jgi:subtilase family serine protease
MAVPAWRAMIREVAMRVGSRAALAVGAGAVMAACGGLAGAGVPAAVAAVQPVPFAAGHVIPMAAGKAAQPPTTAQCEKNVGIACYQPFQLQRAYDLAPLFSQGIQGQGQTIVIVDPFGSPTIASDLRTFDAQTGLPNPPSFKVITPEGPITTTPANCTSVYTPGGPDLCSDYFGWTVETSLDVEWAHVLAPQASIVLAETPMTETEGIYGFPQIVAAENYVIDHQLGEVISQSFGAPEQTFTSPGQIYSLRSAYLNAARHQVTVLAATGDQGSSGPYCDPASGCANPDNVICCDSARAVSWPASDPLVTAVGGTRLHLNDQGYRTAPDSVYQDRSDDLGQLSTPGPVFTPNAGGGGRSTVFSRPPFQDQVAGIVGASRGIPDIAMSAAFNGGVDVYWSAVPSQAGWIIDSGTSEAAPLFAGIVALADQVAGHSLGDLNPALYAMAQSGTPDGIVPISQGANSFTFCVPADIQSNGSCASSADLVHVPGFQANGSYNNATGWGTVDAAWFVPALARFAG